MLVGSDMSVREMSDEELRDLAVSIHAERCRRERESAAAVRVSEIVSQSFLDSGVEQGDEWVQPEGYLGVYPKDWTVTHDGKTWVSLIDGNALEPGVSGWREVVPEGDDPPEYVPPAGYQDAYNKGDLVTFQGDVYKCISDGVTWSPAEAPQHWEKQS